MYSAGMGGGRQEAHVRERVKKAAAAIEQVREIKKKRFGKDWRKRL